MDDWVFLRILLLVQSQWLFSAHPYRCILRSICLFGKGDRTWWWFGKISVRAIAFRWKYVGQKRSQLEIIAVFVGRSGFFVIWTKVTLAGLIDSFALSTRFVFDRVTERWLICVVYVVSFIFAHLCCYQDLHILNTLIVSACYQTALVCIEVRSRYTNLPRFRAIHLRSGSCEHLSIKHTTCLKLKHRNLCPRLTPLGLNDFGGAVCHNHRDREHDLETHINQTIVSPCVYIILLRSFSVNKKMKTGCNLI